MNQSMEITDHPDRLIKLLIKTGKRIVCRPTEAKMITTQNNLQKFVQSFVRRKV